MAHYEQKEIPAGSGNLYWYQRIVVDGRQKSRYLGKRLPPEIENNQKKYEADRKISHERLALEEKIRQLTKQLAQLK